MRPLPSLTEIAARKQGKVPLLPWNIISRRVDGRAQL
jgi:hypothetical protein